MYTCTYKADILFYPNYQPVMVNKLRVLKDSRNLTVMRWKL